ncbi:MAG: ATP-binding cassette domain-containing protein [Patescibacteria group bacterium]|nr:ATP-binding cassette domain-containing protein [Patescibacteria group bacterium]MCL5095898.1 ATP-binding cassette domain-containing protein [Patescibacteria group bacterium]
MALWGPNGSGKTTLINLILRKIAPDAGNIEIGSKVEIGYLPQEHDEINSPETLRDYLVGNITSDTTLAYKLARRFLYSDENLVTSIKDLSSGQKSRLALAKIMASGANFIILDEPTNHLDIPSREALEIAIASYSGTLLVVTHDRYFLDMINPDKTIKLGSSIKSASGVN